MLKKPTIHSKSLPYHVTARSETKEYFPLPLPEMWFLIQLSIKEATAIHHVEVVSFVLMGNHYHMLLLTPEGNLDLFIYEFNKSLAFNMKARTGQINHIFETHYKWCLIQSQQYFLNCYKYIYQNPVRAGLVEYCEDYPVSTLRALIKNVKFSVPVHDRYGFKDEYGLRWLNQKIDIEEEVILKKNLANSISVNLRSRT